MRLNCPYCGARDSREFTYRGAASLTARPSAEEKFFDYVYLRDNPAGEHAELWYHAMGCGAWLKVVRNTVTHEVLSVVLAGEAS